MAAEIRPEHIKKFRKLAKELDKLMHEIVEYNPEASIFVEDSCNFILMKGPCHDKKIC